MGSREYCYGAVARVNMKTKLDLFDLLVIAGGIVNIAVIAVLVGSWLIY